MLRGTDGDYDLSTLTYGNQVKEVTLEPLEHDLVQLILPRNAGLLARGEIVPPLGSSFLTETALSQTHVLIIKHIMSLVFARRWFRLLLRFHLMSLCPFARSIVLINNSPIHSNGAHYGG